jgi:hypothetical protein
MLTVPERKWQAALQREAWLHVMWWILPSASESSNLLDRAKGLIKLQLTTLRLRGYKLRIAK